MARFSLCIVSKFSSDATDGGGGGARGGARGADTDDDFDLDLDFELKFCMLQVNPS